MKIVADENMPCVREWFAGCGDVVTLPGRTLDAVALGAAEALLVRSVTPVGRDLLHGSRVRFVGSATSGIEHIDTGYLRAAGISYAAAPGCNATAVVEYVLSCLCALDGVLEHLLAGGTVGVIGLGHVGARLVRRLQALGIDCVGCDPFLDDRYRREAQGEGTGLPLRDLDTVLGADVVCCHTPLTTDGPYPTRHLLDARRLRQLRAGAVLINAGRGAVVDNAALSRVLGERPDLRVVLDVWEGEPAIDRALLDRIALATPHIAGYSWDGKVAGTRMVLEAFCGFFGLPLPEIGAGGSPVAVRIPPQTDSATLLRAAVRAVYDVRRDDSAMRAALVACPRQEIAAAFDRLRKNYPQRREIAACAIENMDLFNAAEREWLRRLGFAVAAPAQ